jgi:Flp pilus assembly protein TadD
MSKPIRFGSAISAIVVASVLAGCAAPQAKTSFGGKADMDVGVATRALAALNSNDIPMAIDLGERAVAKSPQDAGFRALLGNAYFAGGRFVSAESAYKDSLTVYSNQPQVILKLALVQIALGKNGEALSFLQAARSVLDPADYGLAVALAGNPAAAIPVLDAAARAPGADSRVRQNLALAHALAGDWNEARTIAAQDVPVNLLDARIHQWMELARPGKPSDQIASLVGVKPVAVDQGQPVRLALNATDSRFAAAAPVAKPVPAPQPQLAEAAPPPPMAAAAAPVPPPFPRFVEAVAAEAPAPQFVPAVVPAPAPRPAPRPVIAEAAAPAPVTMAMLAASAPEAPSALMAFMAVKARPAPKPAKVRHAAVRAPRAQLRNGDSVMQLGAYRSAAAVSQAWSVLTARYPALRAYLPLRARFESSSKGTFYRLSVQGFENEREAVVRCRALKTRGGNCFVRDVAGDAPVQIASR